MCVCVGVCVRVAQPSDSAAPMDYWPPGSAVKGVSEQEHWSGMPFSFSRGNPPADWLFCGIVRDQLLKPRAG